MIMIRGAFFPPPLYNSLHFPSLLLIFMLNIIADIITKKTQHEWKSKGKSNQTALLNFKADNMITDYSLTELMLIIHCLNLAW